MVEVVSAMLSETEFYDRRNEILEEEKYYWLGAVSNREYLIESLMILDVGIWIIYSSRYWPNRNFQNLRTNYTITKHPN